MNKWLKKYFFKQNLKKKLPKLLEKMKKY